MIILNFRVVINLKVLQVKAVGKDPKIVMKKSIKEVLKKNNRNN